MLRNHFLLAFRNLRKHRLPTTINVAGLAIGIACCVLLLLYVVEELRFDRFHEHSDRIYRIVYEMQEPSGERTLRAQAPPLLADEVASSFAGIEASVRVSTKQLVVQSNQLTDQEQRVHFADPGLFDVFSFRTQGTESARPLTDPGHVLLSPKAAGRYFPGISDPEGQILTIELGDTHAQMVVAGVLEDIPDHSSLKFDVLVPYERYPETYRTWLRTALFEGWSFAIGTAETFVLLSEPSRANALGEHLAKLADEKLPESAAGNSFHVQPLTDVHLDPSVQNGMEPTGNPVYLRILGLLALAVLLIACINFVTLMIGRSVERAREVGVRKVMGACRNQIRKQFLGEALLTAVLALGGGLVLTEVFLPTFNRLAQKDLSLSLLTDGTIWAGIIVLILGISLLAGLYPASVMAGYSPTEALRGAESGRSRSAFVRMLVGVQFMSSMGFLIMTGIMSRQIDFMLDRDLGFQPDRIAAVSLSGTDNSRQVFEALRSAADQDPRVENVTGSFFQFGRDGFDIQLRDESERAFSGVLNVVNFDFPQVMGVQLSEGRWLRDSDGETGVLVNETFVHELGVDSPLGLPLPVQEGNSFQQQLADATIVGIVRDYHFDSLHDPIKPLVLVPSQMMGGNVMVVSARIRTGTEQAVMNEWSEIWSELRPNEPFMMDFLEQVVEEEYAAERRWRSIAAHASVFILIIACSGLFGLVVVSTRQRRKEIGIRKVLGATVQQIVTLVGKEYALLVGIAFFPAAGLAVWAGNSWLDGFAYRAEPGPELFVAAAALVLGVALTTVCIHAVRAALANPVDSLRTE